MNFKLLILVVFLGQLAFSQRVPEWVQTELQNLQAGKKVGSGGPFGHGTGTYRIANGKEIPFNWISYYNSDGWAQIALTTKVFTFDLKTIRQFRDQIGRRGVWNAWSSPKITWIGTSNDMNFEEHGLQDKYMHVEKVTKLAGGGTSGVYVHHYVELKRDYLDRITAATRGALKFNVAEMQ